jgi:hypothetical protein
VKEAVAEIAAVTGEARREVYQRALALDKQQKDLERNALERHDKERDDKERDDGG